MAPEPHHPPGYTYVAPAGSWLYVAVLKPKLYLPLVEYYPRWIHPNVISLAGLAVIALAALLHLSTVSELDEQAPDAVYMFSGIMIWLYMTLDNTDGAQARRLKLCGPLGELFDHGVDTVVVTLGVWLFTNVMGFSASMIWLSVMFTHVMWYAVQWQHLLTGYMTWGWTYFSVDEALIFGGLVLVARGFFGVAFYFAVAPYAHVLFAGTVLTLWLTTILALYRCIADAASDSRVSLLTGAEMPPLAVVLRTLVPLALYIFLANPFLVDSDAQVADVVDSWYLLAVATGFAWIAIPLIVHRSDPASYPTIHNVFALLILRFFYPRLAALLIAGLFALDMTRIVRRIANKLRIPIVVVPEEIAHPHS